MQSRKLAELGWSLVSLEQVDQASECQLTVACQVVAESRPWRGLGFWPHVRGTLAERHEVLKASHARVPI